MTASHYVENMSIAEVWQDPKTKRWSALAILPRQPSAQVFATKIDDLNTVIQGYLNEAEHETDLLYKFSLIDMAAIYAQECDNLYKYYNVLAPRVMPNVHNSQQLVADADTTARSITFSIDVQENNSLIQFAIEEMLGTLGMRRDDVNPTYVFKEKLTYKGTDTGFGMYLINYTVNIDLLDTTGKSLSVFTFKGKEGGLTETAALQTLQNTLAKDISKGNSELQTDSLLVQFTAFLDSYLK